MECYLNNAKYLKGQFCTSELFELFFEKANEYTFFAFSELLKQNLFKNVSYWVTFLWQTHIQTIIYGLMIRNGKK